MVCPAAGADTAASASASRVSHRPIRPGRGLAVQILGAMATTLDALS
jgi:hypothetical protein